MSETRERSFWGWGWADQFQDRETRKGFGQQVQGMLEDAREGAFRRAAVGANRVDNTDDARPVHSVGADHDVHVPRAGTTLAGVGHSSGRLASAHHGLL